MTRKTEMELFKLKSIEDRERDDTIKRYKLECQRKAREAQANRREKWYKKKEINTFLCGEITKVLLDLVEEIHITNKGQPVQKPEWREYMRKFVENEQIFTHQPVMIEQEDESDEDEQEIDINEVNEDYLAAVGKWNPQALIDSRKTELDTILDTYELTLPDFDSFVNNNGLLGKYIKEITRVGCPYDAKYEGPLQNVPGNMPLKLLVMGNHFENSKDIYNQIKTEFNLHLFDVNDINVEIEKLMNPPAEEEVPDPKSKAKGKNAVEEPPENEEELKELRSIAEQFKLYKEENPGVEKIPEHYLMQILAIKIKYSLPHKTDEEILNSIKLGIKNDIFRPPEEEVDPKKAKGKGVSKEELEEELIKYKKVAPSGYMIVNLPNTSDVLIHYEKVFNGYTSKIELGMTDYEHARYFSNKLFP